MNSLFPTTPPPASSTSQPSSRPHSSKANASKLFSSSSCVCFLKWWSYVTTAPPPLWSEVEGFWLGHYALYQPGTQKIALESALPRSGSAGVLLWHRGHFYNGPFPPSEAGTMWAWKEPVVCVADGWYLPSRSRFQQSKQHNGIMGDFDKQTLQLAKGGVEKTKGDFFPNKRFRGHPMTSRWDQAA